MFDSPFAIQGAASQFFDNYLNCLIKVSMPEKQRRWHFKPVEESINAQTSHKIKALTGPYIARYFDMIGRQDGLLGISTIAQ